MRILITGSNGYIAQSLYKSLQETYNVQCISLRSNQWLQESFSNYAVIIHTAGIAHVTHKEKDLNVYDEINHKLTSAVAIKAKQEGVKQFIFLSSILVYGESRPTISFIDKTTEPSPTTPYGKSKLKAEKALLNLKDITFKVAILRLPMVYGPKSKGNYSSLSRFAKKSPIFIRVKNKRSIIYVEHLTEFIHELIKNEYEGIYFPQNKEAVSTAQLIKAIRDAHDKKTLILPCPYWVLKGLMLMHPMFKKVFGSQVYHKELSSNNFHYIKYSFDETIRRTESTKEL